MSVITVILPEEIGVGSGHSKEVKLRCPTMEELAAAGDILLAATDDADECERVEKHNNATLTKLIRVALAVKGQDISEVDLRKISIANGLVLRKELNNIVGKQMEVAFLHLRGTMEAQDGDTPA